MNTSPSSDLPAHTANERDPVELPSESEDAVVRLHSLSFAEAVEQARNGWLVGRDGWRSWLFWVETGTVIAHDKTMHQLRPFLAIQSSDGLCLPWHPQSEEDRDAQDWAAVTRQWVEHHRKARTEEISARGP